MNVVESDRDKAIRLGVIIGPPKMVRPRFFKQWTVLVLLGFGSGTGDDPLTLGMRVFSLKKHFTAGSNTRDTLRQMGLRSLSLPLRTESSFSDHEYKPVLELRASRVYDMPLTGQTRCQSL